MVTNNPVVESLAAFAIVFAAGASSIVGLTKYIEKVRSDAQRPARPN